MYIVSAPPVNVVAIQSSSSAPVEVSWSPPSDGANIITGYRIFYGSGKNTSVQSVATSIGLRVSGNYVGQNISIRSEANQLYSELINTSVTVGEYHKLVIIITYCCDFSFLFLIFNVGAAMDTAMYSCTCTSEIAWYCCWSGDCSGVLGCHSDHCRCGAVFVEV